LILTCNKGNNSGLLPLIFQLYVKNNACIADVTYGKGVFWKFINEGNYNVLKSDIQDGIDFKNLPYNSASIDVLILDPPYMHGGETVKKSINSCYLNKNTNHESVLRLYTSGILEACRVLKRKGIILIKTQDETESGKQKFTHIEIIDIIKLLGFNVLDLFILMQDSVPAMRLQYQKSARKNHSYFIVGEFRG
jgi:hypothetical protein